MLYNMILESEDEVKQGLQFLVKFIFTWEVKPYKSPPRLPLLFLVKLFSKFLVLWNIVYFNSIYIKNTNGRLQGKSILKVFHVDSRTKDVYL